MKDLIDGECGNVNKTRKVYEYLLEQSMELTVDGVPAVSEVSGNIIVSGEIVGIYIADDYIDIFDNFIKGRDLEIQITDELGTHILLADRDCAWVCIACSKEIRVGEKHLNQKRELVSIDCPKCGKRMQFRYWLDSQV